MNAAPTLLLREWFDEAVEANAEERARLLETFRASDPKLAEQVQRLLAQHEKHLRSVARTKLA